MTNLEFMPMGDPNEAVHFDIATETVTLACGDRVPVLRYVDEDEEEVQVGDLDLHENVAVVAGPLANGNLLVCTIAVRTMRPHLAGLDYLDAPDERVAMAH